MERTRPTIAVIDDDPRLLESLEELLESAGYTACCFRSAGHLLVRGLSDLDLLITDIGMPGTDGFELRDIVKKARPELPVFLITGRHEIADHGRAQGISGFFRKPFDAPALLVAIADALQKSKNGG
ncbi:MULTISPECIES: response regulator [Rhizobium]|jgi:FixJ family two-component response regulator|uniref:Regulator n=1 Tax=Rhizobium altiplani TaxID=1864509 RepID=A0A120FGU2_9HYPH|nr:MULTISPECIES: response regulator [Rhizobium]KWV44899.1 regulator [Rhizobium altiplani]MBD9444749.1 response regulator [Rhizobium sp. RHZ01]MBD9451480.1 response regulator [Rhizobium sp. RHZ02]NMN68257.1 Response regulator containing CheY-like receiver, AAA-type ATPase, and DNA-binding domains [Rhizobium sp. 57MFTsu3.2]